MHELSIATQLVALASEAVDAASETGRVRGVRVRVGELSGVVVDALEFAWDMAVADTRCEGADLIIERVAGKVRCDNCGAESEVGHPPTFGCPRCPGSTTTVIAGRELDLLSLDLDDPIDPLPCPEPPHDAPYP